MSVSSISTAEAFRRAMYRHVIQDNFELKYHTIAFQDKEQFEEIANNPDRLQRLVSENIKYLASEGVGSQAIEKASDQAADVYIESLHSGYLASYAFAFWFFKFDMDNWFEFEQVREQTEQYLDISFLSSHEQAFHLFKGFENKRILKGGVNVLDLPVVTNFDEMTVSLWTCQLFD